jgi:hypothetical protein
LNVARRAGADRDMGRRQAKAPIKAADHPWATPATLAFFGPAYVATCLTKLHRAAARHVAACDHPHLRLGENCPRRDFVMLAD